MVAVDTFKSGGVGLTSPAENAASITPNDSTDLAVTARAFYVGVGGDLNLVMLGGQTVTFKNILGGSILAIRSTRVMATSTTATEIVALW